MKVAILGLGLMGSAMAEGMLNCGHEVIVYNRTKAKTEPLVEKGATAVATPAEAILLADASILVLTDGKAVVNLMTDEVLAATKNKRILNASTTSIEEINTLVKMVKERGGSLSEMSIMVGPEQLRKQEAYFMIGCPKEEEQFWVDVLGKDGTIRRVGEVSFATKAETPIVFASVFSSVLMAYIGAAMIKLNVPEEIVMQNVEGMIPGVEYLLPNIMKRNYDNCMASTESLIGVADAAINTAKELDMSAKLFEDMKELYVKALEKGYGSKDASSITEVLLDTK